MDDFFKSLTNMLVGAGIKGYGAIADRSQMPSNKRIYLETFADENTSPTNTLDINGTLRVRTTNTVSPTTILGKDNNDIVK